MEAPREEPRPWVSGGMPALIVGALVTLISFVLLGVDAAVAFWALTAGLPLIAFVVIGTVWMARRVATTADDEQVVS